MAWQVHVHGAHVPVRRRLHIVGFSLSWHGSGDPIQVSIIRHYQASQISLGWRGVSKSAQTLCKMPPSLPSLLIKLLKYAISKKQKTKNLSPTNVDVLTVLWAWIKDMFFSLMCEVILGKFFNPLFCLPPSCVYCNSSRTREQLIYIEGPMWSSV